MPSVRIEPEFLDGYLELWEFLGDDGLAGRIAGILIRSSVAYSVTGLLAAHQTDPDRFTEIKGIGSAAADRIYRLCEARLSGGDDDRVQI